MAYKASENCYDLIRHYESLHDGDLTKIGLQWKLCPAGIVTVGYGHALYYKGEPIKSFEYAKQIFPEYETITKEIAEQLLREDVAKVEKKVNSIITRKMTQGEFDALVSYFFNIGHSNTMVQLVNAWALANEIHEWFTEHYITGGGKFLPGLLYRRKTESHLFTTGELLFFNN